MCDKLVEKFVDIVAKSLKASGADSETLELWKSITQWYEEGGPDVVDEGIMSKAKEIKGVAAKQLKETKEAMPKKKKKRKTKR
jgi:hypothetical protein